MACRERDELNTLAREERVGADQKRVDPLLERRRAPVRSPSPRWP